MEKKPSYQDLEKRIAELEKQSKFYKTIADNTYDWEIFRDTSGKIIFVNKAFERITGYKNDDLLNGRISEKDIVHPNDREAALVKIKQSLQQKTITDVEFRIIRTDNQIRFINLYALPVYENGKFIGVRTSARDITQQKMLKDLKKLHGELQKSQTKFYIYIQNSPTPVFLVNAKGQYQFVNHAACKLLGYSEDELLQLSIPDIIPNECLDAALNNFKELQQNGQTRNFEIQLNRKDGKTVDILLDGKKLSENEYIAFVKDISSIKKSQQAIIDREETLNLIFENIPLAVFGYKMNGAFVIANNMSVQYTGYSKNELLKLKISDIDRQTMTEKQRIDVWNDLQKKEHQQIQTVHYRKDGTSYPVEISLTAITLRGERLMIAIAQNITERQKAQQELMKAKERTELNETKYKSLFENITVGVALHEIITDEDDKPIDFRWLDVNPAYEEITKLKADDIIGKRGLEIIPELEQKWIDIYGEVAQTGKPVTFEEHSTYLNKYWNVKAYSPKKNHFAVALTDITKRREAEFALLKAKERAEESESRFKALHNASFGGIAIHDIGLILDCNQGLSNITGYSFDELIGMDGLLLIAEETRDYVLNQIKSGYEKPYEAIGIRKNGEKYPVRLHAKNIPYKGKNVRVVEFRDITEQKQIQNELIKAKEHAEVNEKKYRSLFASMQEGFYLHKLIYDKNGKAVNYRIIDANPISEKYVNIKPEDAIGKLATELYGTDTAPYISEYARVAQTGKPKIFEEYFAPMDRYFHISVFSPQKDMFATVFLNITKTKKYEKELIKAKERAENSERELSIKNEAYETINEELRQTNEELFQAKEKAEESNRLKTAFLQNISHEIRTPMNAIVGFSNMLSTQNLSQEKHKSFISIIQHSSSQLLSIVTDILTISSIEANQEKPAIREVCINSIIIDLLTIFRPQAAKRNLSLYAKQPLKDKQSEIFTDKTKLTQILSNLITNALKFTHHGYVEFGYQIKDKSNEPVIMFFVKDTGIGIPKEQTDKIFERFRQADLSSTRKYGGTGLGLSISKGLVEILGGKIWVESERNKGSTFCFTIPYEPVMKDITPKEIQNTDQNNKTVLVAEDEEYNSLLLEEMLKFLNVKTLLAKNGKEAIELCKENPSIDLILMDIKMPVLDGYNAAKQIRKFRPGLPIIAQTAYALEKEIEVYGKCFDEYITKPIDENELANKLELFLK